MTNAPETPNIDVRQRRISYFSAMHNEEDILGTTTIKVHRMNLKVELIKEFTDKKVII